MKKIIWLFFYILSVVGISLYGGRAVYGFHFAVLMFPVVCALYLVYVYFNIRIYQKVEGRTRVAGHPGEYRLSLQNESPFAFSSVKIILYSDFSNIYDLNGDLKYELMPHSGISRDSVILCKYRGHYNVGVKELVIEDFFGFFKFKHECMDQTDVWVKPNIVYLDALKNGALTAITTKDRFVDKTERDVLVRDYIKGDPIKDINWKSSARTGKLLVRNRIGEEKQGVTIFMDTRRYSDNIAEYLPLENKIIEATIALVYFFCKNNIPVNVALYNKKIVSATIDNMDGFNSLYSYLSDIVFTHENNMDILLDEAMEKGTVYDSKICYMIMHKKTESSVRLCETLDVNSVLFVNYIVTDEVIKESKEDIRVSPMCDLKEVL